MKQYWIITQLFYPDETSTGHVMTKIAESLTDHGQVNVVCGSSAYQSKMLNTNEKLSEKIKILRIKIPIFNKNILLFRLFGFFYFSISVLLKIIFKIKKEDTVLLVTNPPFLLFIVGALKYISKFKFVIILQDIFPENAAAAGMINNNSIFFKFILNAMNFGYRRADQLIACGSDMAQLFINKGIKKDNIFVIPNWADQYLLDSNLEVNRNEYFLLDLGNKVVLEFAGNVGRVQGLEDFLKIFSKSNNIKLVLLIIGDGANKQHLMEFVKKNKIFNVHFFSSKPRLHQSYFLNCCDIGLVTLCEGMLGLGVPSKVYNIMSMSKPVLYIGDKNSEIDNYINSNKIGWSFRWKQEKEIIDFLNNIDSADNLKTFGINARDFVINNFTETIVLNQYKNILN